MGCEQFTMRDESDGIMKNSHLIAHGSWLTAKTTPNSSLLTKTCSLVVLLTCCLLFGRSGYRRRAFRYIFARHVSVSFPKIRLRHFDKLSDLVPVPESLSRYPLAKDAAPIPNALAATTSKVLTLNNKMSSKILELTSHYQIFHLFAFGFKLNASAHVVVCFI